MAKHIEVHKSMGTTGDAVLIRFLDKRLIDPVIFEETYKELVAVAGEGYKKVVLTFNNVEIMSNGFLNTLLDFKKKVLDPVSGRLRICAVQPQLRDAIVIPKLDKIFDMKNTEKDALEGF